MDRQLHAVVLPYPGQGHINPLMQLSLQLSSMGFLVTFVTTRGNYNSILDAWSKQGVENPNNIRMVSIADDALSPRSMTGMFQFVEGIKQLKKPFAELMHGLVRGMPVSCVISDVILTWVSETAQSFGIPWVPYYPLAASGFVTRLHAPLMIKQGIFPLDQDAFYREHDTLELPGVIPVHPLELPQFAFSSEFAGYKERYEEQSATSRKAPWLFINTCETLEQEELEYLRQQGFRNLMPVAPLLPASFIEEEQPHNSKLITSSLWEQDYRCTQWLDKQSPSSVLYISFGSIASMKFSDVDILFKGLVRSQVKFLWVLRKDLIQGTTEEEFQAFLSKAESSSGLVVHWASQLGILKHVAVRAFLTHCGWNSTFESICAGVPMICWPRFADQKMNARYVSDVWKVGVKLKRVVSPVSEDEVERIVVDMMSGEQGELIKERAMKLSVACKKEFAKKGLQLFVSELKNYISK